MAAVHSRRAFASNTPFDRRLTTAGPAPAVDLDTAKLDQIWTSRLVKPAALCNSPCRGAIPAMEKLNAG